MIASVASTSESTTQFAFSTNGNTGSTGSNTTTTTTTTTDGTSKESPASGFTFGQTTTTKPVSMNEKTEEGDGAKDQTAFETETTLLFLRMLKWK